MALLQTHLVFFIAAIIIVVRLFSHDRLKRLVFLGLRGWTEDLSAGEVQAAVALYGKGPSHEAFLAELERLRSPPRVYEWRDSLVPSVRSWSRASGLDEEPSRWVHTGELLSLLNLCLLLAFSYVLVGSYECLEGSGGVPSYHVTLLAACTLGTALAYLAMPLWSMGVRHLDVTLALSLGSVASVICTLGYAYLYSATRAGARDIPWVDLGAPLGQGIDATLGPRGPLLAGAGVALFTLVTATLLVTPALRAARYFSARMEAAQALPGGGRWAKAAARVGMYAPALVAALWFRPLISVTAHDAVPCSPLLQALSSSSPASSWGVGVSRDCRASLASQGSAGGESLLGLLPLWAVQLLPGEGWAAYASSTLARHYWIGESSWLRWRAAAVLTAACGGMLWQWRGLLQAHLDCAWVDGGKLLARAGRRAAKNKAPGPCTASHGPGAACPRPAPECSLKEARMKGLFTLSQAAMQLLAVPAVLGSLSVLLTRGTGLGGVGACHTGRRLVEGVLGVAVGSSRGSSGKAAAAAAAAAAASTDSLTWVLAEAGKVLFGPAFTGQLLAARQDLTITVLSPALWRPVLSYLLLCTLLLWWVLGELGLMYWRVAASSVEEAEEREEEREEESRREAEAEAAAAKAKAAAAAKAPRAAAIVEDVD